MTTRRSMVALAGTLWTALAVLDPRAGLPAWPGLLLTLGAAAWELRKRGPAPGAERMAVLVLLAAVYAVAAHVAPNFGADSRSYLVFLPAALRGEGVDFGPVFAEWGLPDLAPDSVLRRGLHPVGPALVWSPFFLVAHVYVLLGLALGRVGYAADGLAAPYLRAPSLGTGLVAVLGVVALFRVLRRRHSAEVAALATAVTALATTLPYYVMVQPAMAHGLVFGAVALWLAAWAEAERAPTRRRWIVLGALTGLLALLRWQAAVAVVLPAALAVRDLSRRRIAPGDVAAGAALALAVFAPQLAAWKLQHGRWVTNPQGAGYVDWTSPYLLDVLVSADRGLFAWTPLTLVGLLGLLALLRRDPLLAGGSLAVFALTAWVNGGVSDWAGSDAYGARRFDVVLPLLAVGLARVVEGVVAQVARRPIWAPAALALLLAAWNLGLLRLYATGRFRETAPLEQVAAAEAGLVRRGAERVLGALFGARGRDLAYRFFVGEYFYVNANLGGTIHVGGEDGRYLGEGWSGPRWHDTGRRFRWALYPVACVRVPLREPVTLDAVLTARVPRRLGDQRFAVTVNGHPVGGGALGPDWADVPFTLPAAALVPGENLVCFRFERPWGEEGAQVGAQVARVQLP